MVLGMGKATKLQQLSLRGRTPIFGDPGSNSGAMAATPKTVSKVELPPFPRPSDAHAVSPIPEG